MTYKLFLDDERDPTDVSWLSPENMSGEWVIIRNVGDAVQYITNHGAPSLISFDHDLGEGQPTGMELAKWIVEADLDGKIVLPEDFDFQVHSRNPVGTRNIASYLGGYLQQR